MGGQHAVTAGSSGRASLALIYQEILTAITRFRSNRQAVSDATSFRNQLKGAIGAAEAEATRAGYASEDVRLATFAVVALLDESILNSNNPIFADWPRMSLQEELFGVHTAGEMFFQCVDRLMSKSDSPHAIDVLEIYDLCMLLGYRGKYSLSGQESVRSIAASVTDKLQRARGGPRPLAPHWAPSSDVVQQKTTTDPWVRALLFGTLGALVLAVLFFVGFKFVLISGASGLHSIAPPH
jgi:type VI secretion system protein ImpK